MSLELDYVHYFIFARPEQTRSGKHNILFSALIIPRTITTDIFFNILSTFQKICGTFLREKAAIEHNENENMF